MNEITTRTERTGTAEVEPKLTISQLQGLFREAAALERAQRPIILHGPETPPVRPGIDVRIPAAPAAAVAEQRNIWPLVFMVSGCTGLAACTTAAATGNGIAILALFAAVAAWGTAAYQLVFVREP